MSALTFTVVAVVALVGLPAAVLTALIRRVPVAAPPAAAGPAPSPLP